MFDDIQKDCKNKDQLQNHPTKKRIQGGAWRSNVSQHTKSGKGGLKWAAVPAKVDQMKEGKLGGGDKK